VLSGIPRRGCPRGPACRAARPVRGPVDAADQAIVRDISR